MTVGICFKCIGCLLIIAGSSGWGCWMAGNYRSRLCLLEQLRQMVLMLKGQILYANAPLQEGFEAVGQRTEGILSDLFSQVAKRIDQQQGEPFCQIWKEEVGHLDESSSFSLADRQSLAALGEHLGFMDKNMQEKNLLLYLEELDLVIEDLRKHKQERCRLYISLGIMGGLFLAVLLL